MRRILFLILLTLTGTFVLHAQDSTDTDGIPANCESVIPYANPLLFPRYTNGTLALINWSSGETALILEQNSTAPNFWFVGWSPDCHYLAGGLGDGERYTTIIWDALTGARIGTVEDGYRRPHFLTWSPRSDAVVVETRNGAFLWNLASGTWLRLTVNGFNGRSFSFIHWNYDAGLLEVGLLNGLTVPFSLLTGHVADYVLPEGEYLTFNGYYSEQYGSWTMSPPSDNAPFGCPPQNVIVRYEANQVVFQDTDTAERVMRLNGDFMPVGGTRGYYWLIGGFSPNCDMYFFLSEAENRRLGVIFRLQDNTHIHAIPNIPTPLYQRFRYEWDPTGRYFFAQSYDGAQIWDSVTDSTFYVTTPEESARNGFSVDAITWDIPNGRATLDMLYSRENRVIDLATGQRIS